MLEKGFIKWEKRFGLQQTLLDNQAKHLIIEYFINQKFPIKETQNEAAVIKIREQYTREKWTSAMEDKT